VSGGVDSAVVLMLSVRAFGSESVIAVFMPDQDSDPESEVLVSQLTNGLGLEFIREDITAALQGFGCYERRDEAIRRVFPEYDPAAGYKAKLVLPGSVLTNNSLNIFSLTIVTPNGDEKTKRLARQEYLQIVAASNFKQRGRMAMLYYHAEARYYAVVGTANKNEREQGFTVKYGDSGVDVQPIAHLYKTQVYQLAEFLNVPEPIRQRIPTSDTYSAHQSQEEFFFRIPFETMDLLWSAQAQHLPLAEVAQAMGLTEVQVQRVYDDFSRKQRTTNYLRMPPLYLGQVGADESLS